jgi:hypothetical protein
MRTKNMKLVLSLLGVIVLSYLVSHALHVREGLKNSNEPKPEEPKTSEPNKVMGRSESSRSGSNKQERGPLPSGAPSRGGTPQQIVRQCLSLCGA